MTTSSILGGVLPAGELKGRDAESLGPSDSSDSGSDAAGAGDHAVAEAGLEEASNADILPDRVGVFPDASQEASTAPEAAEAGTLADDTPDDLDEGNGESLHHPSGPPCVSAPGNGVGASGPAGVSTATTTPRYAMTSDNSSEKPYPFPTADHHPKHPDLPVLPVLQDPSEDAIDSGIEESFPASDPVSVTVTKAVIPSGKGK